MVVVTPPADWRSSEGGGLRSMAWRGLVGRGSSSSPTSSDSPGYGWVAMTWTAPVANLMQS